MKPIKKYTLSFYHTDDEILLAMKLKGFGQGRWNGYGGKKHNDETIQEAAIRETNEEIQITATSMEKKAIILFELPDVEYTLEVHVFRILEYEGEPTKTEEMNPKLFKIDDIPYNNMWPDDKTWLPIFLEGKKFEAKYVFDKNDEVVDYKINEVKELER